MTKQNCFNCKYRYTSDNDYPCNDCDASIGRYVINHRTDKGNNKIENLKFIKGVNNGT